MMLRKSYFQKLYHLEVDFVVTEALAYGNLFNGARTRFLKKYIKIMNRSESNSISYTKGIRYCRGSAFAMHGHITKKFCRNFEETFIKELYMDLILLARYAFNGDLGSRFIRQTVPSSVNVFFLRAAMFIGYLFSLRDRISGGLEKTHKEFDKNIKIASIYCLL